ncbi:MAG: MFS transporter [Acidimicrobiia bacterium]|nr:MFS transporter [Acidimicrobiia bacterium]
MVWLGQLVSISGTTLSAFGLQLFVFVETGSVTKLSFVVLAFAVPGIVLAPMAGSVADRFDRRLVMLIADGVAGAATLITAGLFFSDALELWHIYLLVAVGSGANAFQEPAWLASIPMLVPKEQLGRANGLVQLNQGISIVVAPAAAGALLAIGDLGLVLMVDAVTFVVGVLALASVRFPRLVREDRAEATVGKDALKAWRYLRERPGLFGLLWLYSGVNFMLSFGNVLFIPLILSFSTEAAAGAVLAAAGFGAIVGSLAMAATGGPKRLVRAVLGSLLFIGVFSAMAGLRASVPFIAVAVVLLMLSVPIANTASQVIWQTKVELGMQGRIFSLRRMISSAVAPAAILLAGPLADKVFEPRFEEGGGLADSVGSVIGTGPGRGIGFLLVLSGIGAIGLAVVGWLVPRIRNIETDLPDQVGQTVAAG